MTTRLALTFCVFLSACAGPNGSPADVPDSAAEDAKIVVGECDEAEDGTPCSLDRICLGRLCVDSICGDGFVDPLRGEECDDGNVVEGDGCEIDCTFTCHTDAECDDGNMCTEGERCVEVPNGRACQLGTPKSCAPTDGTASPCTIYGCAPAVGCDPSLNTNVILCYADADQDGYPDPDPDVTSDVTMGPECDCPPGFMRKRADDLWDCNDTNPNVHPAQTAYFTVPHCTDGSTPTATATAPCPGLPQATCATYACADGAIQPSYDYNCDMAAERRHLQKADCKGLGLGTCAGEGWKHGIPPCGATATWDKCVAVLFCGPSSEDSTQACN